jgi:HDOD domain
VPPPDNVLKYFRAVGEPSELPLLPSVAGQVLKMVKDPDFNARELCRVLSNDAALAGRILAVSRSPYYAQRMRPRTLLEAITVLGFRTVTSVVLATAGHTLCVKATRPPRSYGITPSELRSLHESFVSGPGFEIANKLF